MTAFIQRSFSGGELDPALYSRVDLSKYSKGLRTLRNFVVSRGGGAKNRSGSKFISEIRNPVRLIPYAVNDDVSFVCEFGQSYIRFILGENYVTLPALVVNSLSATTNLNVNVTFHGYKDGDQVSFGGVSPELDGRQFVVYNSMASTFELLNLDGSVTGGIIFTPYISGGSVRKVYTLSAPYASGDLSTLNFSQSDDDLVITHLKYLPSKLKRTFDTEWSLTPVSFSPSITPPTSGSAAPPGTGTYYVVTALKPETFEESLPSAPFGTSVVSWIPMINVALSWTAVSGAAEYNVYKSYNGINGLYGFIGSTRGLTFNDRGEPLGIEPDSSITPPENRLTIDSLGTIKVLKNDVNSLDFNTLGPGVGVSWSPDSKYVALAHATGDRLSVYRRDSSKFTLVPFSIPHSGDASNLSWHKESDGSYLLAASYTSAPSIKIYRVVNNLVTETSLNANVIAGNARSVKFSPDGVYLCATYTLAPFVNLYKNPMNGAAFINLGAPAILPTGAANACDWSKDGVYLAVSHDVAPYIRWYKRSGDTLNNLPTPAITPTGNGTDCAWSTDTNYLAVSHAISPYMSVYKRVNDIITKIANPSVLPTANARGCDWSVAGNVLFLSGDTPTYVLTYKLENDILAKYDALELFLTDTIQGVQVSPDGAYVSLAGDAAPYISNLPLVNNFPNCSSFYQQRQFYANTDANPQRVWGSAIANVDNFTSSRPIQDDHSMSFVLKGNPRHTIKNIIALERLILFTSQGEWILEGSGSGIVTPTDPNPKKHSHSGSASIRPIVIDGDAIFNQEGGSRVRSLSFDFQIDGYRGNDLTVFASHFFDGYTILDWDFQKNPNNILYAVRNDGKLLSMTYVREQEIMAWSSNDTDGLYENVCSANDRTYTVVNRDGRRFIEIFTDGFYSDSSLSYDGLQPSESFIRFVFAVGDLPVDSVTTISANLSSHLFVGGDIGNEIHIYAQGRKTRLEILNVVNEVSVQVKTIDPVPASMTSSVPLFGWALAVDELNGLSHLEGKNVSVVGDDFVVHSPNNPEYQIKTVTNGKITLSNKYAKIIVGLPYLCDLETLDIDTLDGETMINKYKRINEVAFRVDKTRGMFFGPNANNLTEFKGRLWEDLVMPNDLISGTDRIMIEQEWNSNGRVFLRQIDPLPINVLSIAPVGIITNKE